MVVPRGSAEGQGPRPLFSQGLCELQTLLRRRVPGAGPGWVRTVRDRGWECRGAGRQAGAGAGPRSGMQHPTSQLGKDAESFENAEEGRRGKSAAKMKYSLAHVPLFVSIFSHFTQLVHFSQHSLTSTLLTVTFYVGNESRSW